MALFGLIKSGEGGITITLPEWMSKEFAEIFLGGLAGGFLSGALTQLGSQALKLAGAARDAFSAVTNALMSFAAHWLAARKLPTYKNILFGVSLFTGVAALKDLINLILSRFNVGIQMLAPWDAFNAGRAAVVRAFAGATPTKVVAVPATSPATSQPERPRAGVRFY